MLSVELAQMAFLQFEVRSVVFVDQMIEKDLVLVEEDRAKQAKELSKLQPFVACCEETNRPLRICTILVRS